MFETIGRTFLYDFNVTEVFVKLVLPFLKPHWKMCLLTVFLLLVDVVGALIIPTFAAELMNEAGKNMPIDTLITTAVLMGVAALIAGAASIGSVFAAFGGYAITSIKANRRFAMLDGISFFAINILIILVYTLSGFRISAGAFLVGDITAIIEYSP